jgi:hypothetical protein
MVELGEPKFLENKTGTFFLCHNRSPKSHRYALLTLLKHENIIDNVINELNEAKNEFIEYINKNDSTTSNGGGT